MSARLEGWLLAFLFTQLVEVPIYARALGVSIPAACGASAITHPIVWFGFFSAALDWDYRTRSIAAETFAWTAEALYFALLFRDRDLPDGGFPRQLPRTLFWSFVANASSLTVGLLSRRLFGVP